LNELKSIYGSWLDKGPVLQWEYASDLPTVQTDGAKLKHILHNLISNAIKFTQQGTVTISARHDRQNKTLEFKVSDTGIGIQKELHGSIFEKFRQADASATRAYEGMGLGLYVVKQFTELVGGTVDVESDLGRGSCFTVKIPAELSVSRRASETAQNDQSFS
jgi:signal transduction histidine kinase